MENPFAMRESFVLTCPICYDSYNEEDRYPMLLCSNQHHCCLNCLLYFFADRPPLTAIPCPNCREPITLERSNRFRLLRQFNESVVEISDKTAQERQMMIKLRDEKHELVKELEKQKQITEIISAEFMKEKSRQKEKWLPENIGKDRSNPSKSFMVETMAESRKTARKRQPKQKEEELTAWKNCDSTYSVYLAEECDSALKPKKNYNPPSKAQSKQTRFSKDSSNCKKSSESVKRMPTKASVRDEQKPKPVIKPLRTKRNVSVYTKSQGKAMPYFILDVKYMDSQKLRRIGDAQTYESKLPLRHMVVNILVRYDFSQLLNLNLSKMHLTNVHLKLLEGTKGFQRLSSISLAHNRLRNFPLFLVGCRKLQILDLSYNLMEEVDSEIGKLADLKELNLWNNNLSELPEEISSLKKLEYIDLSNNRLTEHPQMLLEMKQLQRVDLYGCFIYRNS